MGGELNGHGHMVRVTADRGIRWLSGVLSRQVSRIDASELPRRRGRPRTADIDDRILAATRAGLVRSGYAAMTMEGVAREAGVGRQSLYRRWPRKPLLVFDATFRRVESVLANLPDTGSLAGDIDAYGHAMDELFGQEAIQDTTRGLLADALGDRPTLELLRERFIRPHAAALGVMVDRARLRSEVAEGLTTEMIGDLLLGVPLVHYLIIGRTGELAHQLTRIVSRGVAAAPSAGGRGTC
jgi:AcrR family transcriptional regulator